MELSKFSTYVVVFYFVALCKAQETCRKDDVCSCTFKNGWQVNLWPIDGGNTPRFKDIKGDDGRTFQWNPCTPFKVKECRDTMVCQIASVSNNAGSEDSTFLVDSGNVVLTYGLQKGADGNMRQSKITLVCDPLEPGNGTIERLKGNPIGSTTVYTGTFTSSYACARAKGGGSSTGLSAGSILLIVFFPLLLLYIVAGILVNYHGRGVRSMPEMLPNYSFWADFPFLVKDGAVLSYGAVKSACFSIYGKFKKDSYAEI